MRALTRATIATAVLTWTVGMTVQVAHATPDSVEITRVHETASCSGGYCQADDPQVNDGGVAQGRIQVNAQADPSSLDNSMEWFELEARLPGAADDDWICIAHKDTTLTSTWMTWSTTSFPDTPSGCSSHEMHNRLTPNGMVDLRVAVNDGGGTRRSGVYQVYLGNRPNTPEWYGQPRVLGNETESPRVQLRWAAQPDEGIVEYHIVRMNPDGSEVEFAINAKKPGGQGCSPYVTSTYTCYDDSFPSDGYGGDYSYVLFAYRQTKSGAGERCEFTSDCIQSRDPSDAADVALINPPRPTPAAEEAPPPSQTPTPTQTRRQRPRVLGDRNVNVGSSNYADFFTGTYDKNLYKDRLPPGLLPGGGRIYAGGSQLGDSTLGGYIPTERDRRAYVSIAGGLLMLLVAAHMMRLLRRSKPI